MEKVVVAIGKATRFLRLDGPFQYPTWVSSFEKATKMSPGLAEQWRAASRCFDDSEAIDVLEVESVKRALAGPHDIIVGSSKDIPRTVDTGVHVLIGTYDKDATPTTPDPTWGERFGVGRF